MSQNVSTAAVVIGALKVKHYSYFLTDRSKAVLLLLIIFVIAFVFAILSCLFLSALW